VWPHLAGFNRMNVEAPIPQDVFDELKVAGISVSGYARTA
jgi:hypothetical protein